jgi:hypothetical protein
MYSKTTKNTINYKNMITEEEALDIQVNRILNEMVTAGELTMATIKDENYYKLSDKPAPVITRYVYRANVGQEPELKEPTNTIYIGSKNRQVCKFNPLH